MSEERWPIPNGWSWKSIGEIAKIVGGGTPSTRVEANFSTDGIPWITPSDLTGYPDKYISRGRRDLSELGYSSCSATLVPAGTVLFSSRAPIGYCVIAANEISTNQGFKSLILKENIEPEYIRYYLLSAKQYAQSKASGTTFLELSAQRIAELSIPIAPYSEQKRIVSAIDNLKLRTNRSLIELENIPALLENYTENFLTKIFSGGFEAENINSKDFQEKRFETVIESTFYGPRFSKASYKEDGYPTVRTTDFTDQGNIELNDAPKVSITQAEYDKWGLIDGDILVTRTGSIGKCAVYYAKMGPAIPSAYLIRVRLDQSKILPDFALYFLLSPSGQHQLGLGVTAVAQPNINAKVIQGIQIPVPPVNTQKRIISEIKITLGKLEKVKNDYLKTVCLLDKLNSAILDKAFRGELLLDTLNILSQSSLSVPLSIKHDLPKKKPYHRKDRQKIESPSMIKKLQDVLLEANDWMSAQEAFRLCGVTDGTQTERIEELYAELRELDKAGHLQIDVVRDEQGRKICDRLRIREV